MSDRCILIADDEEIMRMVLRDTLEKEGFSVETAEDGMTALELFQRNHFDLLISDIQMTGLDGIELLKKIKEVDPDLPVIIMTAFGSVETAVAALRYGAFDYITKPFITDEIRVTVRNALRHCDLSRENRALKNKLKEKYHFENIIGQSQVMQQVYRLIERLAASDTNVLITGDSGTGKELVAHAIHYNSKRAQSAFVSVNCSAIPDTLMESEMFGHVKGAFTNAYLSKQGLFEEADGGTLFLDEIADLSLYTQAKLLRAIQTGEIKPVGGTKTKQVNTRIISATNKRLETEVKENRFREDLYYRLNVVNIQLPGLSERPEDIPELANHFLNKFCEKYEVELKHLSHEVLKTLMNYSWPGNVRELENCIERAIALSDQNEIRLDDLPPSLHKPPEYVSPVLTTDGIDLNNELNHFEISLISKALNMTGGNITKAAQLLAIPRRTLSSRMQRLGIDLQNYHFLGGQYDS